MRHHLIVSTPVAVFIALFAFLGAAQGGQNPEQGPSERPVFVQKGIATWYGGRHDGHKTASGENFNVHALTAAHRTLPFGTVVRVTDVKSGRAVMVRINDRGPNAQARSRAVLDLSERAANALDMRKRGACRVTIEAFASDQSGS